MENSEVLLLQDGHSFPSETFTFPLIVSALEQDDQWPLWKNKKSFHPLLVKKKYTLKSTYFRYNIL